MFLDIRNQNQKVLVGEKFEIDQSFLIIFYFMISGMVMSSRSTIQRDITVDVQKMIIEIFFMSWSMKDKSAILSYENVYASTQHMCARLLLVKEVYSRWSRKTWMTRHEARVTGWFFKWQTYDDFTIIEYRKKTGRTNRVWQVIELWSCFQKLGDARYPRR